MTCFLSRLNGMTGNIFIIGTRAQLIKVAPIILACEKHGLHCLILMTGQHHEIMQDLVSVFVIRSPIRMASNALHDQRWQILKDVAEQLSLTSG
jgi:UDP-N-acetylglucosamine 2-epimerase (non-hydrolysing)